MAVLLRLALLLPVLLPMPLLPIESAAARASPAAPSTAATTAARAWSLTDQASQRFSLGLFEQPDPAFPAGWRLRLTGLSPALQLDHSQPLRLTDGMGHHWSLPNRSVELVPPGRVELPAGSAQFDAGALVPRPSQAFPLQLSLETARGTSRLMLPADGVKTLGALPRPEDLPPAPRA